MMRAGLFWCVLTVLLAACAPNSQPKETTLPDGPWATHSFALPSEPKAAEAPFGVVSVTPEGETRGTLPLTIVFNRSLAPLDVADEPPSLPITLTPDPGGRLQWLGRHAVQYVPTAGHFPPAQHFEVTLSGTLAAADGSTLGQDLHFSFETPPPRLERSYPDHGRTLTRYPTLYLNFDQKIDVDTLRDALDLQVNGASWPRRELRPRPNTDASFDLQLGGPLPLGASVVLSLSPGVRNPDGPNASQERYEVRWQVRDRARVSATLDGDYPTGVLSLLSTERINSVQWSRHLRITPPVHLDLPTDDGYPTQDLYLYGNFQPRTQYSIALAPGLRDADGEVVPAGHVATISVDDFSPRLFLGADSGVLRPGELRAIALSSLNIRRFDVAALALKPEQLAGLYAPDGIAKLLALPEVNRVQFTQSQLNTSIGHHWEPASLLEDGTGPLLVAAEFDKRRDVLGSGREANVESQHALLRSTRLGITAKVTNEGVWLWLSSLEDNKALSDARVSAWTGTRQTYDTHTDRAGAARIPLSGLGDTLEEREKARLVVQQGSDWTFIALDEAVPTWYFDVERDYNSSALAPPTNDLTALVFTERGIYRPGDKVWIKGIVRTPASEGSVAVSQKLLTVRVLDSSGKRVIERRVSSTEFGTFAIQVPLGSGARLGHYRVELAEVRPGHGAAQFQVAEYRPSEFEVSVKARTPELTNGSQWAAQAGGRYLFGGPMNGATASFTLRRDTAHFRPPIDASFETTDHASFDYYHDHHGDIVAAGKAPLDAHGQLELTHTAQLEDMRGPEYLTAEVGVSDVSRQTLFASAAAVVHPADFYLGVRASADGFVVAPTTLTPDVIAVTPRGVPVQSGQAELTLTRRRYTWAKRNDGGQTSTERIAVDDVVGRCTVALAGATRTCPLPIAQSGSYVLRATSRDSHGHTVAASRLFYAVGQGPQSFADDDTHSVVELVADKATYQQGETATILVKSPFKRARALVTLERESVLWHQVVELQGGAPTVQVPITSAVRPNAYVSVHLLSLDEHQDALPQQYRIGYTNVRVDAEQRRLNIAISPNKQTYRPGEHATVEFDVRDVAGRATPAELTVYVVDEGALALTGYSAPDPLPVFTAQRPLRVDTLESRANPGRLYEPDPASGASKGDEGGGGGGDARSNFKQTAFFAPSVVTDARGHAQVQFQLPDNLTSFRIMAVGVAQSDRYGTQSTRIVVNAPLMARPALPRLLRAGDHFSAGVIIDNHSTRDATVLVKGTSTGVHQIGKQQATVSLPAHGSREVRFEFVAKEVGTARFTFDATAGSEHDRVTVSRPVSSPMQLETVAVYGETETVDVQALALLSKVRPDAGRLEVSLSSSALVGLDGAMTALVDYPYLCSEQLTSRLFPLIPLADLATAYGFKPPKNSKTLAARWLGQLLRRQNSDGGFSTWEAGASQPWTSAYAALMLSHAHEQGYPVEEQTLTSAGQYVRRHITQSLAAAYSTTGTLEPSPPEVLIQDAFHLYVLTRLNAADADLFERLYELRERMPPSALALLLLVAPSPEAKSDLERRLVDNISLSGLRAELAPRAYDRGYAIYHSDTRAHALALLALAKSNSGHALLTPLARGLLAQRRGEAFGSTQESAFALLALQAYYHAREKQTPNLDAHVYLDRQALVSSTLRGRSTEAETHSIPMAKLLEAATETPPMLAFQSIGQGHLYYQARVQYARQTPPTTPLDTGFFVATYYRKMNGVDAVIHTTPSLSDDRDTIVAGDVVAVDVVALNPITRRNVAIDSPFPAGFEAIDSSLLTTSSESMRTAQLPSTRADHKELRDDRALFFVDELSAGYHSFRYLARATTIGEFVTPPTRAFEMYQPEVAGRTAASVLRVAAPAGDE